MKEILEKNPQKYVLFLALGALFLGLYESLIFGQKVFPDYFFSASIFSVDYFSRLLPFVFLVNGIVGWFLIHRVFMSHNLGFFVAAFSMFSPLLFSLGLMDHSLWFLSGFLWIFAGIFFCFFSPFPSVFFPVLGGISTCALFVFFPFSHGISLIFSALILAFSLATIHYSIREKYYYFLLSAVLGGLIFFLCFRLGNFDFWGKDLSLLAARDLQISDYFRFSDFYTTGLQDFFPGILMIFVASLGLIFYWYRFVLLAFLFGVSLFFSFGAWEFFWASLGLPSGIFLLPVMAGLLFFSLLFIWFSRKNRSCFFYGLELCFIFILLVEGYHLAHNHAFWDHLEYAREEQREAMDLPSVVVDTQAYLQNSSGRAILDDRGVAEDFLWKKSGLQMVSDEILDQENLLALFGVGVVFSEKISAPNPNSWEKISLGNVTGFVFKSALPEFYLRPLAALQVSEKLAYRIENTRLNFDQKIYSEKNFFSEDAIVSGESSNKNHIQILEQREDSITMKVWTLSPSFLVFSDLKNFDHYDWHIRVNGDLYDLESLNLHHRGILLGAGVYEIFVFLGDRDRETSIYMKGLGGLVLGMLMIEFYLRMRRRK